MNIQLPDTQLNVLISKDAVHEEEMMVSNFVKLTWNDATRYALPVGSYIVYGGVKYRLFEEYQPTQTGEASWKYEPQFQHPTMWLKYVPYLHLQGNVSSWGSADKKSDWTYSGYAGNLIQNLLDFMKLWGTVNADFNAEFFPNSLSGWTPVIDSALVNTVINISFNATDLWSAMASIAGQLDCEFHFDFGRKTLFVGTVAYDSTGSTQGDPVALTVGTNVGPASVSRSKEFAYNRYVVHGGTKNISQKNTRNETVQVVERLPLPDGFTDSIIDLRSASAPTGSGIDSTTWDAIKAGTGEPALTGELVFDDVYPKVEMYMYALTERIRKRKLTEDTYSDTDKYSDWYFRLAVRDGSNFSEYSYHNRAKVIGTPTDNNKNAGTKILLNLEYNDSYFTSEERRPSSVPGATGDSNVANVPAHFITLTCGDYSIEFYVRRAGGDSTVTVDNPYTILCYYYGATRSDWTAFYNAIGSGDQLYITKGIDLEKLPIANIDTGAFDQIAGTTLQVSFLPNQADGALNTPLTGRTYEVAAYNEADEGNREKDDSDIKVKTWTGEATSTSDTSGNGVELESGLFRILSEEQNSIVIPQCSENGGDLRPYIYDENPDVRNNKVSLIGVAAPTAAITAAKNELLNAAIAEIYRKRLDNNNYTLKSYPHIFKANNTSLFVGEKVTYSDGNGYTLNTHIRKLVTRLDFPEIVEITVGNEKHKGPISTLKEQVNTTVYYGGGVSAPSGGSSPSSDPSSRQTADRLTGNTPHRVWGQPYWQNGVPSDVSGSLSDVENILMDGFIEFGSNSRIYEDSDRKLKLRGYNGIEIEHNLFIGTDLAIKTAAVGENGTDLLAYKSGDWGGVTGAHWFVGAAGVNGFIRSYGELKRWKDANTQYRIWDESNLNPDNYLPLTGGSVESLTIASSSSDFSLELSESGISFKYGGSEYGSISLAQDSADIVFDISSNATLGGAAIATESWVEQQGYVTLNGEQTITGAKTFSANVRFNNSLLFGDNAVYFDDGTLCIDKKDEDDEDVTYEVWHTGNLNPVDYTNIIEGVAIDGTTLAPMSGTKTVNIPLNSYLSGYATTNQLDTGLAAKQNKMHFLNRNNNNTESYFSYLYLPLRDVNSGYAELDCVPVTGMNSFFLKSQLGVDNYPSRVGHAVGMQSKLNQYGTGDNGVRGGVYFMFGRSSNSSQDVFERININCLSEYKSDDYNSNYGLSITPTALTFLGNTVYHAGNASSSIVTLSDQQTISGAKTFSADVTHSGTSEAKFGSLSSIYENSSNVLVLTGGNGIELNDDTNVGNGYSLTFNNNNGISNYINSYGEYLELWGANGVIIDDAAFIRESDGLWKLATEDWVENCIGSAATLTIAQVTSSDQKVVTSGMTFTASNGTYLLKGNSNNNGKIVLRARFTVSEECLVKVTLTASSEQNYDFGVVGLLDDDDLSSNNGSIGNKILAKVSGNNNTVTKFVEVPAGDHYFEIGYVKDSSQSVYDDSATIKIEKVRTAFDCLPISGGTMTGDLNLGVSKLKFQNGQIENTILDGGYMHLVSAGGQFHFHGDTNYGTCVAAAFNQQSDLTLKNVKLYLEPSVEDIAAAPIIEFSWKGDTYRRLHLGSAAQYWRDVFPQATLEDANGKLAMDYGAIALAGAVTAARKAVALEQRVSELERLLATK